MDAGRKITSVMAHVRYAAANRIRPRPEISRTFYPQQPTCQISNMWLIFETFFGQRTEGLFVEVGAFDGVLYSNTWGLAARGWRGLLIEPVPEFAAVACHEHGTSVAGFLPGSWDHLGCQLWDRPARRAGGSWVGSLNRRVGVVGVEVQGLWDSGRSV